jgi:hypothetical protein
MYYLKRRKQLKKYFIIIISLFLFNNYIHADIIDRLEKYRYNYYNRNNNYLTLYDSGNYFGYLYLIDNYLQVGHHNGDLLGNCIVAVRTSRDKIELLIKHLGYGPNEIKYFYVEITEIENEINCSWEEVNSINLNGFIFNQSFIMYYRLVNIMFYPSVNSETYIQFYPGERVEIKVLAIGNRREIIDNNDDFWYQIEYDNKILWIHGYNLFFSEGIKMY